MSPLETDFNFIISFKLWCPTVRILSKILIEQSREKDTFTSKVNINTLEYPSKANTEARKVHFGWILMYVLMGLESFSFLADFFSVRTDLLTLGLLALAGLLGLYWGLKAVSQLVVFLGSRGEHLWITDSGWCTKEGKRFRGLWRGHLSMSLDTTRGIDFALKNWGCKISVRPSRGSPSRGLSWGGSERHSRWVSSSLRLRSCKNRGKTYVSKHSNEIF